MLTIISTHRRAQQEKGNMYIEQIDWTTTATTTTEEINKKYTTIQPSI